MLKINLHLIFVRNEGIVTNLKDVAFNNHWDRMYN